MIKSVQDGTYALGKAHMRSTPSLEVLLTFDPMRVGDEETNILKLAQVVVLFVCLLLFLTSKTAVFIAT